jgi:opacity protein-like surface antigen
MNTSKLAIALVPALGLMMGAALAADLGPSGFGESVPVDDPMVELGSGWYLRGDAGAVKDSGSQASSSLPKLESRVGWNFDVGAGYRFNNWFRTDLTIGMDQPQKSTFNGPGTVICPYTLGGLTDQATGFQVGYLWSEQAGTCAGKGRASLYQADVLLNSYVDLGTWYNITPYIGAGVGVSDLRTTGSFNYYKTSDGSVYNANLTPTGTFPLIWTDIGGNPLTPQPKVPGTNNPVAFAQQNWAQSLKQTRYNFAWALMGGFAYNITDHTSIDIGYRYLNRGNYRTFSAQTGALGPEKTWSTQAIRVGLRYMID